MEIRLNSSKHPQAPTSHSASGDIWWFVDWTSTKSRDRLFWNSDHQWDGVGGIHFEANPHGCIGDTTMASEMWRSTWSISSHDIEMVQPQRFSHKLRHEMTICTSAHFSGIQNTLAAATACMYMYIYIYLSLYIYVYIYIWIGNMGTPKRSLAPS